jgi:hypothetical protein
MKRFGFALILGVLAMGLESSTLAAGLSGAVKIDGSSTVDSGCFWHGRWYEKIYRRRARCG